jgi:hypothetical protein
MVVINVTVLHYSTLPPNILPTESIGGFIDDQVYDLAPRPHPPSVSDTQEDCENRDTSC